ncbi:transposase [Ensifer sp. NBAIM29]|nr:transposase [Ensifer sp. NBAIM29]
MASHAAHGAAGLSKKFNHYDAEFKLSVLKRMWEDGLSCRQKAALFNIRNASYLSDWQRRNEAGGLDATKGRGRAIVAVARKIAVVLHRMWIDGTEFRFGSEAAA